MPLRRRRLLQALLALTVPAAAFSSPAVAATAAAPQVAWAKKVPNHLALALRAVARRMARFKLPDNKPRVELSREAEAALAKLKLRPVGFALKDVILGSLDTTLKSKVPRFAAEGTMIFQSSGSRRAVVYFAITYGFDDTHLVVERAVFAPVPPERPMITVLLLPGDAREAEILEPSAGYEAAFRRALEKAYDLRKPMSLRDPRGYLLVLAISDWLPKDMAANLWLSENADAIDPPPKPPNIVFFGGWRIYARRIPVLSDAGGERYAKVSVTGAPGKPAPRLISVTSFPARTAAQ